MGEKIGEAMVVAFVLAYFVDEALKKELLEEASRDLLPLALGYHLPPEVIRKIKQYLSMPFVRQDFVIRYRFETISAFNNELRCLRVRSIAQYKVLNLTDEQQYYPFRSSVVKTSLSGDQDNELVRMEVVGLGDDHRWEGEKLKRTLEGSYLTATQEVRVPKQSKGPLAFRTERIEYYRFHDDSIVLDILKPPCIGLEVIVEAEEGFDFLVSFGPDSDPQSLSKGTHWRWSDSGVHLPGSHFRLTWRWSPTTPPATETAIVSPPTGSEAK